MYIARDRSELLAGAGVGFKITYLGTDYTFGDSANNVFTGQITSMLSLFQNRSSFNQGIGYWDTSNVADMGFMFQDASSFNQPIGGWNTSNVRNMENMFYRASSFNKPIGA